MVYNPGKGAKARTVQLTPKSKDAAGQLKHLEKHVAYGNIFPFLSSPFDSFSQAHIQQTNSHCPPFKHTFGFHQMMLHTASWTVKGELIHQS